MSDILVIGLFGLAGILIAVFFLATKYLRTKPVVEMTHSDPVFDIFKETQLNFFSSLPAETEQEKAFLLSCLFEQSAIQLTVSIRKFSMFKDKEISSEEQNGLFFESLVFLGFLSSLHASGHNQPEEGQRCLQTAYESVLDSCCSEDPEMKELAEKRIETYMQRRSSSGSTDIFGTFLNYLKLLSEEKTVSKSERIAEYGAFKGVSDWSLLFQSPALQLFKLCLDDLCKNSDISLLSAPDVSRIIRTSLSEARLAEPPELSKV